MDKKPAITSRRDLLRSAGIAACAAQLGLHLQASAAEPAEKAAVPQPPPKTEDTYATQAKGIRILPGQWRPHYPWEHIAWISPAWPSQDYIWLDCPEAVFTNKGLLFLSHINPPIPTVFSDLPKVPWKEVEGGIAFERELPNGVAFGTRVTKAGDSAVDLEIHIRNGTAEPLGEIMLQTCAFLRAITEFGDYTHTNKFVHTEKEGWIMLGDALKREDGTGRYRVGWRHKGKLIADLPVAVAVSKEKDRLLAMSWGKDTMSLVGNQHHPCIHADPEFPEIAPGQTAAVHGRLVFFEGKLEDFKPEDHFVLD